MRGATGIFFRVLDDVVISIHAPHAGSDWIVANTERGKSYFNPRSPCGERLRKALAEEVSNEFQSTLPMRGATWKSGRSVVSRLFQSTLPMRGATMFKKYAKPLTDISIHAPHAGSDLGSVFIGPEYRYFNPRSPCGERRLKAKN